MKMKKLFLFVVLICSIGFSQSDNIDTTLVSARVIRATLTTAIDTLIVRYGSANEPRYSTYTMLAHTTAGADTLQVFTRSWDDSTWSQSGVVRMSDISSVTVADVSTTEKEFIIGTPQPYKIMIISTSNDGSTTIVRLTGKK
jgi:hypothetical protein